MGIAERVDGDGVARRAPAFRDPAPIAVRRDAILRPRSRAKALLVSAAAIASVLVVLGAFLQLPPVEALGVAARGGGVDATLHLPAAYIILSPVCEGYDALTLLTLSQHGALLGWLLVLFGVFRIVRRRHRRMANVRRRAAHTEGLLIAVFLVGFAAWYTVGALVPRPMAAIELPDRDELAVDVHSHTSASHDGRRGFDAEADRRWHAAAGFAAAYVTDHRNFGGAIDGVRGNPARAGEGTILLPGLESAAAHSRILILGARAPMGLDHQGRADLARLAADTNVVVVLTTPASLARIPATMHLDAVESSDGAPRGLMFTRRLEPEIGRFARSRRLARVAGSNNHGWGRTASAWTVLRIPGWRMMSPGMLDRAIRTTLNHPGSSVRVVARGSTPLPRSAGALLATPALIAWSVVTRLTLPERVSWLAWIWGLTGLALLIAVRRGGAGALPNGGASSAGRGRRFPARGRRAALRGR